MIQYILWQSLCNVRVALTKKLYYFYPLLFIVLSMGKGEFLEHVLVSTFGDEKGIVCIHSCLSVL